MSKISVTGDRPTGKLHLGHFVGSLQKRLEIQHTHQQFIMVADIQALTGGISTQEVRKNVIDVMKDYLSVGLLPDLNTFCLQSAMPALHEITCHYFNLVTLSRLLINPTIKQEANDKGYGNALPMGFLCHPISQAADITALQADIVPVGEDQKPLIEQTNEIVDKFSSLHGHGIVKRVNVLYGETPRLLGVDGNSKASKSLGNAIMLTDNSETVKQKIWRMFTDPNHIKVSDPGTVEGNVVFHYLDVFYKNTPHLEQLKHDYRKGGLGDTTLKQLLFDTLESTLEEFRQRRALVSDTQAIDILVEGTRKANMVANKTLHSIREVMSFWDI